MEQAQRIIRKISTMISAEELIKNAKFHVAGHLPRLQTRAPLAWNLALTVKLLQAIGSTRWQGIKELTKLTIDRPFSSCPIYFYDLLELYCKALSKRNTGWMVPDSWGTSPQEIGWKLPSGNQNDIALKNGTEISRWVASKCAFRGGWASMDGRLWMGVINLPYGLWRLGYSHVTM